MYYEWFFEKSPNHILTEKIVTIIAQFEHRTGFQLSNRHLSIKGGDIDYDSELFFLKNEFVLFHISLKNQRGYRVVIAHNDNLGTFAFYIPETYVVGFRELRVGDDFKLEEGFVKKIKKARKKSKNNKELYFVLEVINNIGIVYQLNIWN